METRMYVGMGEIFRTRQDAETGQNPMSADEVDALIAAQQAEKDRIQEARIPLACAACGTIGERKLPTRGASGQPDVLICATLACLKQWRQKVHYLNNR